MKPAKNPNTCPAGSTLDLLRELREEGYRQTVIDKRLSELAVELRQPHPDLTVVDGRIPQDSVALVEILYERLTS